MPYDRLKRWLDVLLALIAMIVFWPLLLLGAAVVWLCLGRPILFRQQRPGRGGVPFILVKFRTMTAARDQHGNLHPDEVRLGKCGRLLRSTSIDELPQLWNVLKGEMSFVGPRPLLMEYLPLYTPHEFRRHEVRPGLTGWAQIQGRNDVDWKVRLNLDVWYVDNRSFWLDVRVLLQTVHLVLSGRGVNRTGYATMAKYDGTQKHRDH